MLKGPYSTDYPARETALAIIAAMKNPDYRWADVERVTGLDNALYVADRCFMVFGYPELDPGRVSRWVADRSVRPSTRATLYGPSTDPESRPEDHTSYGFTPRR